MSIFHLTWVFKKKNTLIWLIFCLPVLSNDNLYKLVGPRSAWQTVCPDLSPDCLTLMDGIPQSWDIFMKMLILDKKSLRNYQAGRVNS